MLRVRLLGGLGRFSDVPDGSFWWECPQDLSSLPCCWCLWLFWEDKTSVQSHENLPKIPKVVGEGDRQTYTSPCVSKVHIAVGNMVKNRPWIPSHKQFQAQSTGRSFTEAGARCVARCPCPCEPCGCNVVVYFLIFACLLWSFLQHFSREGWTCALPSATRSWNVALPRCPPLGMKPQLFCISWWEITSSSPNGERFWERIFRSVTGEKLESRTPQI